VEPQHALFQDFAAGPTNITSTPIDIVNSDCDSDKSEHDNDFDDRLWEAYALMPGNRGDYNPLSQANSESNEQLSYELLLHENEQLKKENEMLKSEISNLI